MRLLTSALVGGTAPRYSWSVFKFAQGAGEVKTHPFAGHTAVHQDEARRENFMGFYFEIYTHVIDIHIYHSRAYISSIFLNEQALT